MKKLVYVFFMTMVLLGCSSDDNSGSNGNNQFFNPPKWIHGTWLQMYEEDFSTGLGYKFTSNDFCTVVSQTTTCLKEHLQQVYDLGQQAEVDEEIKSNTEYKFSYTIAGVTQEFHFRKVSDTKIEMVSYLGINAVLEKQ